MKSNSEMRNPALDIVRCTAFLCVISMHFFKFSGYYYKLLVGGRMFLLTFLRSASAPAVPLFLLLSGYLMLYKQPNRQYYRKLGRTLSIYILASICCYCYKFFCTDEEIVTGTLLDLILQILNYEAAPYAWYIHMYIGLFLIAPYLNILYHGLQTRRHKQQLLLVLMILTALPGVINVFSYSAELGLSYAANTAPYQRFVPDWWVSCYPITYYLLGAYLRDYPLFQNRRTSLLCTLAAVCGVTAVNLLFSRNSSFVLGPWQDEGSLFNVILSALVFNHLATGDYHRLGSTACRLLARISELSLGAYLVSWIFDCIVYEWLLAVQPVAAYTLEYYPVVILVVAAGALLLSAVIDLVYRILCKLFSLFPFRNASSV